MGSFPPLRRPGKHLLLNGCPKVAEEEICHYLHRAETSGALTHEFLEQFCGDFIQMLTKLPPESNLQNVLAQSEIQAAFSSAAESLDNTKVCIREILRRLQFPKGEDNEKRQVDRVVEYIQNHLCDEIRRSDIADAVYLNSDYLSRLFRKETGMSLKEYILRKKMKTAQAILRSTSLPVAVVAARVGFENYSYFSQVYKKAIGITPSAERGKHTDAE